MSGPTAPTTAIAASPRPNLPPRARAPGGVLPLECVPRLPDVPGWARREAAQARSDRDAAAASAGAAAVAAGGSGPIDPATPTRFVMAQPPEADEWSPRPGRRPARIPAPAQPAAGLGGAAAVGERAERLAWRRRPGRLRYVPTDVRGRCRCRRRPVRRARLPRAASGEKGRASPAAPQIGWQAARPSPTRPPNRCGQPPRRRSAQGPAVIRPGPGTRRPRRLVPPPRPPRAEEPADPARR